MDDGREFEAFFETSFLAARMVAFRILGDLTAAEDAAAEALARALVRWRRLSRLPHREAWVLRVTANVAVDALRRRRPVPLPDQLDLGEEEAVILRVALGAALQTLPRRQREAVVLAPPRLAARGGGRRGAGCLEEHGQEASAARDGVAAQSA